MKLIIEIPLDLYARCKSGDYELFDDTARAEIIKNGTPYEPSGEAISREALKEAFENLASDDYNEPI